MVMRARPARNQRRMKNTNCVAILGRRKDENARLIVSRIVIDALKALKLAFPRTSAKRRREQLKTLKELAMPA